MARVIPKGMKFYDDPRKELEKAFKEYEDRLAIIPLRVTLEIIKVSFLRGFSYAQLFDNGQAQAAQRLSGF